MPNKGMTRYDCYVHLKYHRRCALNCANAIVRKIIQEIIIITLVEWHSAKTDCLGCPLSNVQCPGVYKVK